MKESHGGDIYGIARRHNLEPGAILDFSASINPLGPSPRAKKKIRKRSTSAVLHYPDPDCFELRRAVAQFHGIAEDLILPGAGSTEFIYSIPRALKIRKALIVTPAFSEYEAGLESSGESCEIHFLETAERDGFELNVEGLILALTQGYDALYLCNPNNPTGILTERKDLLRILARTEREKTWFILDEAFIDFLPEESLVDVASASSRLLILRTLANFFALPGLRAGYLVSNPEMVQHLSRMQPPWPVNAIAQVAAAESLRDESFICPLAGNGSPAEGVSDPGPPGHPRLHSLPQRRQFFIRPAAPFPEAHGRGAAGKADPPGDPHPRLQLLPPPRTLFFPHRRPDP